MAGSLLLVTINCNSRALRPRAQLRTSFTKRRPIPSLRCFGAVHMEIRWDLSELQAELERDHARRAVSTQADSEQSRWRRRCIGEGTETCLRGWFAGYSGKHHAG